MPSHGLIHFERERLQGRVLDPTDPSTVELEAAVYALATRHALSELYSIEVELEHDDPNLDVARFLWRRAVVDLSHEEGDALVFHGIVESTEYLSTRDHRSFYRVVLRPALHQLHYRQDTRIFQDQSIPDIVQSVIAPSGQRVALHLREQYPAIDYLVQHQESDLAFVQRLLEDEGIYFWFEHTPTAHVLHLADSPDPLPPLPGDGVLRFANDRAADPGHVTGLRFTSRVVHDMHVTRDWDYWRPNAPLEGEHAEGSSRRFERYEYPGGLRDEGDARRRALARLQSSSARKYELTALAGSSYLLPGHTFTLVDARPAEINLDYLLTRVEHRLTTDETTEQAEHLVTFAAMPASQPFRPARRTPRPRIAGRESAVITGPASEEIHVDELGRVRAQLYWDRHGQNDEHSSTWIRVAQPNTVGSMYLPRIGWEAAIGYVDGDPDRPIVTHQLYNARRPPPYDLPDALPYTTWQSASSPGGGGSNELRFDDTNGSMQLYIHAQRDLHARAGHDRFEAVGVNSTEEVRGRLNTSVGAMETITVGIDQVKHIDGRMMAATGLSKTVTIAQLDSWNVRENHSITNDGDRTETIVGPRVVVANAVTHTIHGTRDGVIGGAHVTHVGASMVEAVGGDKTEIVQGARVALVRGAYSENVGRTKTLSAQAGTFHSRGSLSVSGGSVDCAIGGKHRESVTEALGVAGSAVTVRGQSELKARAAGSELVLGGASLDVDATSFSSSGAMVRLLGQIQVIGGDSAESAEPAPPGPEDDWIEIVLLDTNGDAVGDQEYVVRLPDGSERRGRLDSSGRAREEGLPPGTVTVSFPNMQSQDDEAQA